MASDHKIPDGFKVGHWTDELGRTGCTVVLMPGGAIGGVDVRGAAPATLCTDTLRPGTLVDAVHGILLAGGSAFGLASAGGVMRYLSEQGIGFELASVHVPIVAGAVIFDLPVGDPTAYPDADAGYAACAAATVSPAVGAVGAGIGATVAKGGDGSQTRPGGVGIVSASVGQATLAAIFVVNSVGGIWDDEGQEWVAEFSLWDRAGALVPGTNTTIGVVLTDARLTREQANRLAAVAHDGIARVIRPSHTMYDGDTIFCLAGGAVEVAYDALEATAVETVARAIVSGVIAGNRAPRA